MHHLYPVSKGDQLCPLGFHPQVRWPTRCKRCFRDYKEHGGKRNTEDIIASTPNLSNSGGRSSTESRSYERPGGRTWTSSQNLSTNTPSESPPRTNGDAQPPQQPPARRRRPASWTSTPDLNDDDQQTGGGEEVTVTLPRRRHTATIVQPDDDPTHGMRPPLPPKAQTDDVVIYKTDSLAERYRKMQLIKRQSSSESFDRESPSSAASSHSRRSSEEKEVSRKVDGREKSPKITITAPVENRSSVSSSALGEMRVPNNEVPVPERRRSKSPRPTPVQSNAMPESSQDVRYLMHVKASSPKRAQQDDMSSMCTDTTATTIIAAGGRIMDQEMVEQLEQLKQELDTMRQRCEKAERDKSDLMLRRLASMDTMPNKTAASEALKLQKQVNELNQTVEDLRDEKKALSKKVQDLSGKGKGNEGDLLKKLEQLQKLCDTLRIENEEAKREVKNMEQEMDEIQDNFREEQVDEFSHIKKDLDQTTKNCRILSFKLKKADRRIDQLELERKEMGANVDLLGKLKRMEEQLKESRDQAQRLEMEKLELMKKKTPNLATIGKTTSADGKVARGSLIRSGSQDDPGQLQMDLYASMEREADLREQLKFAQEEGDNLRKKSSRIEDENESLMMQLKKMATRSRTRKLSPTSPSRLSPVPVALEKDEGISDEEDPAELRLLLELNEQEASVLRRKVEELETENSTTKRQIKELEEKLIMKDSKRLPTIISRTPAGINSANERRIRDLEESITLLNKKLAEKERELAQAAKGSPKLKSSDNSDTQTINFKRKLEIVEQEATVLRTKMTKLEQENEKLSTENKKLSVQAIRGAKKEQEKPAGTVDVNKIKEELKLMELERDDLKEKVKSFMEASIKKLPERTPKKYSEALTKPQVKKLVEDLELEVIEARAMAAKNPSLDKKTDIKLDSKLRELEATKAHLENQLRIAVEEKAAVDKVLQSEKREKDRWEAKVAELDGDLASAKRTSEKIKTTLEKEVAALKTKAPDGSPKKLQELKKQITDLESRITEETDKYKELTGKYELLEEEHVLTKAQLTTEKEKIQNELNNAQGRFQDFAAIETKLKSEATELTRKLRLAEGKVRDLDKVSSKNSSVELERNQMRSKLLEMEGELRKVKRENEMNVDKAMCSKKETEELRRKLDDFERLDKAQRTLNDMNSELENEVRKLKIRLENSEMNTKSEVASTRLRYEQQMKNLHTELASMQSQCERFKRDRDSFKQLLEGAQKKIAELKQHQSGSGRQSRSSVHSDDDDKSKIQVLEQQVGCLEDELSECRLDQSKLKTELVSERTTSDVKISELQSQINELEEERLLSGGSKIPGTKTRIELSWQKEREEQQRLLQETSTLARDLRQTLFEVERERDKERLEMRRKLDQLKKNTEDEMEESRRKVAELQCDLLELRDAHAKLRTANEKLRRERERHEREREAMVRRRLEQDGDKKIAVLLQTVDELVKVAPELKQLEQNGVRGKSPGPMSSAPLIVNQTITRLAEASEELRKYQRICEDERQRDRLRRGGMQRAASTENDPDSRQSSRLNRHGHNNSSLTRKTLSLDQSLQKDQNIWKQDDGSMSSMQSIDSEYGLGRDSSMDSRLSGGSTQSDMPRGTRKKKRGLMGKLKSLAKSRGAESDVSQQGSDSDLSLAGDLRGSKSNIKGRLSGMFRRSATNSRAGSTEKITSPEKPVAVQTICTDALPASTHPPPSPNPSKLKTTRPVVAKPPPTPNQVPVTATLRKTNIKLK